MDISFIYNSKEKISERIILLEFSSYKSFFKSSVWKLTWKKWLKLTKIWISQS